VWQSCWNLSVSACGPVRRARLFGQNLACDECVASHLPPRVAWKCARFIR
jgi:hypothetical protein